MNVNLSTLDIEEQVAPRGLDPPDFRMDCGILCSERNCLMFYIFLTILMIYLNFKVEFDIGVAGPSINKKISHQTK